LQPVSSHRRPNSSGAPIGGGAQIAAIGGVADERLVAALELLVQRGDDRLPVGSVLDRLGLVAADDVAPPLDLDLLGEQLGLLAIGALDTERRERLLVGQHDGAHQCVRALAGAEHVFQAAFLERGNRRHRDHAAVGHDADTADAEAAAEAIDHRH